MRSVHINAFDLNLLIAFEALWLERHVTRAARRIGLSQPALSHALSRLRSHFDDRLFQPTAGGMIPTARAQALAPPLTEALQVLRGALESPAPFQPRALRRRFTIVTIDYAELVLLPRLLARLEKEAPEVTLLVRPAADGAERELLAGTYDLMIAPAVLGETSGIRSEKLFAERFVCLLRSGHPAARKRLTVERFVRLSHVLISPVNVGEAPVDAALRALGRTRRVTLRLPHFLSAPFLVAESNHVITLPARVAEAIGRLRRFAVRAPPVTVPGFSMFQFWHERNDHDPGHRWFRTLVAEVARGG